MKFRKAINGVELPEKSSSTLYVNIRSAERVDVRSNEMIMVDTGIEVLVPKNETVTIFGAYIIETVLSPGKYQRLTVPVRNTTDQCFMVYPGQVLASLSVVTKPKPKKVVAFKTSATLDLQEEPVQKENKASETKSKPWTIGESKVGGPDKIT